MWHMKRCAVLGSGEVGQTLSKGLKKHGYEVRIGSRTPAKLWRLQQKHRHSCRNIRRNFRLG
jgi:predicted dinucleotide-binding enzyme